MLNLNSRARNLSLPAAALSGLLGAWTLPVHASERAQGQVGHIRGQEQAAPLVAVVSTGREPNGSLSIAQEAVTAGARYVLFPEWGFLPGATPISTAEVAEWASFSDTSDVYVILGARFEGRNTIFVFDPEGQVKRAVRRDGYNSPAPTLDSEKKPLVVDSPDGRIGVLICDESRSRKYFDEMKAQDIDALFVPNYIGTAVDPETLARRYATFEASFDRFNSDRLAQFGGAETHVYRASDGSFEFNAFGAPVNVGARPQVKVDGKGVSYSISLHPLSKAGR